MSSTGNGRLFSGVTLQDEPDSSDADSVSPVSSKDSKSNNLRFSKALDEPWQKEKFDLI
jgi:hypothetical protein